MTTEDGRTATFDELARTYGADLFRYAVWLCGNDALAKDLKVNIRSISLESSEGMFTGRLSLLVKDIEHLDNLIGRLKKIKGIYSVSRYEPV